jgi:hypothetical protein
MENRSTGLMSRLSNREMRYKIFVGIQEGKRKVEKSRCTWEYNIKMDFRETGCWRWGLDLFVSGNHLRKCVSAL